MFLGLSVAAVATSKVECRSVLLTTDTENLLTADSGKTLLTTGRKQCRALGPWGFSSPAWSVPEAMPAIPGLR